MHCEQSGIGASHPVAMEARGWSVAWQRCRISHVWMDICARAVIVFKPTVYFHHPLQFDWVPYFFQPHPSLGDKLVLNKKAWWPDFWPCDFIASVYELLQETRHL
jgi:hypothetical protein